jgi:hypothetical protein
LCIRPVKSVRALGHYGYPPAHPFSPGGGRFVDRSDHLYQAVLHRDLDAKARRIRRVSALVCRESYLDPCSDGDIFGNGVNVAARLGAIADRGGVAAILAADVAGYSRLMSTNEAPMTTSSKPSEHASRQPGSLSFTKRAAQPAVARPSTKFRSSTSDRIAS